MIGKGALYGIIAAIVIVGGSFYYARHEGIVAPSSTAPAVIAAAPQPAPSIPPARPSDTREAEVILVRQLLFDVRQAMSRKDYPAAGRALDQAERLDPRSPDVIAARRTLNEAQQ